ncbi:MAG: protoglobin domain-containing protein [Methyloceanibacter sp.]|jgi:rsbT co-antagonist protein RsbR|uniref:protoglobin domain-containing protein n=1 Tax=Methyloceanibacter sp. TaxID=1965321 RepID=UPI003C51CDFA
MSQSLEVTSLLERFDINQDDLAALKTGGDAMKAAGKVNAVIDSWYVWLEKQPEFPIFFSSQETVERVKRLQTVYWENFFSDEIDQDYVDYRVHIGQIHAQRDLSNLIYFAAMARFNELFSEAILSCGLPASDLDRVFNAFNKLIMLDAFVTSDQVAQFARRRVIESGKAMLEMSTPVTSIWDGILLLPLVGVVDSQRTQDIMDKSLSRIAETRARMFVMDISGVVTVDTAVANNFIRITQATRLMGCDCIISGISPNVARTLVELGANVGEVRTTATLRDALQLALATLEPTVRGGRGQGEGALR